MRPSFLTGWFPSSNKDQAATPTPPLPGLKFFTLLLISISILCFKGEGTIENKPTTMTELLVVVFRISVPAKETWKTDFFF